ncbi:polysaccharide pyruvyl transferase family protein [Clostridium sp. D43t1_170807_H7]|uniref:polysaccharide pyruvyl transferase family protein n=1 Tax=Clostridium sp. D43t1_170807_H7 TaxID=2787140 RepID=UPI00189B47DC|nr:polysaccharide pyruvyl transferase family protein [Clostridium sp. D43t1_170807_H7]
MRVGIITITNGQNYGNRLQNYAVQVVLESIGCEAETIKNITGDNNKRETKIINSIKKTIHIINDSYLGINNERFNKISRYIKFEQFTNRLINQSKHIVSKGNISDVIKKEYDYFITGSDQVWNPNFFFNSEIEFLTFAKKGQKIAYSPSFGISEIPIELREKYSMLINQMDHLSVREEAGAEIIKDLTGRDASVLVDPTMMLSKHKWLSIANKPKWKSDKEYILTYFLGNKDEEYKNKIDRIKNKNNLEVINLLDISDKNAFSVDPSEFLWLINNAKLMCTDSFHGIVFSLIMKTNFILFTRKDKEVSMNSRLETLLSKFNMNNRVDKNIVSDEQIFNVDFSKVDEIISIEKEKAINYLKNALNIK